MSSEGVSHLPAPGDQMWHSLSGLIQQIWLKGVFAGRVVGSALCAHLMDFPEMSIVLRPNKYLMSGEVADAFLALEGLQQLLWRGRDWSQLCDQTLQALRKGIGHLTSVSLQSLLVLMNIDPFLMVSHMEICPLFSVQLPKITSVFFKYWINLVRSGFLLQNPSLVCQ